MVHLLQDLISAVAVSRLHMASCVECVVWIGIGFGGGGLFFLLP